jgi:hypothetical protein
MKSIIKSLAIALTLSVITGCSTAPSQKQNNFTKPGIDAALSGIWVGSETDDNTKQTRTIELDLRMNDLGRVNYTNAGCSGMVKYQRHEDGVNVILLEQIEQGVGNCPRNSYLRLTANSDGSLRLKHFDLDGKRTALGQVNKASQVGQTVDKELQPAMLGTWTGNALTADGRTSRIELNLTPYGRSNAVYKDLGCITEVRSGAIAQNAMSTVETPIKGNVDACVKGVVTYALKNDGTLARINYTPGRGSYNITVLSRSH